VQKLQEQIDGEEQPEARQELESKLLLAEEEKVRRRWAEFNRVNAMLSDELQRLAMRSTHTASVLASLL
jgi:hypothetical protein